MKKMDEHKNGIIMCTEEKIVKETPIYKWMGGEIQDDQKREAVTSSSLTWATDGNEDIYWLTCVNIQHTYWLTCVNIQHIYWLTCVNIQHIYWLTCVNIQHIHHSTHWDSLQKHRLPLHPLLLNNEAAYLVPVIFHSVLILGAWCSVYLQHHF